MTLDDIETNLIDASNNLDEWIGDVDDYASERRRWAATREINAEIDAALRSLQSLKDTDRG